MNFREQIYPAVDVLMVEKAAYFTAKRLDTGSRTMHFTTNS